MKKQQFSTQCCGLLIVLAGTLAPLTSALAADELGPVRDASTPFGGSKSMGQEGFTAEPRELYTGLAAETKWQDRGAQGPIRETTMKPETKRFEQPPLELYNPPYQPFQ